MTQKANTERLSMDLISAIKEYSYNSISGFYERHHTDLGCSLSTFYYAMRGQNVGSDVAARIMDVCNQLRIFDSRTGNSQYLAKMTVLSVLCEKLDGMFENFDPKSFADAKDFYLRNRPLLRKML